ncbi:MAG: hypothetical protein KA712_09655 [Myxococcales bacterium]|nr:hypothetical protein [Myxococcales bacterium]
MSALPRLICVLSSLFVMYMPGTTRAEEVGSPDDRSALDPSARVPRERLSPDDWERAYDAARLLLRDGQFAVASYSFTSLAAAAPDVARKRLALEQSWLATYWWKHDLTLQTGRADPNPRTRVRDDRRTTDELAVLYTSSVIYGLGTGITLAVHTEPASAAAGILPTLGFAGAAALLVRQLDRGPGLRYGAAQAISSGLFVGFEEGLAWILWKQAKSAPFDDLEGKTVATILWGTSTLGAVAGGLVGQLHGTTPGRAALMGSGALWSGSVAGFATAAITDGGDASLLAAAIALNAGALGGVLLGDRLNPSIARVRFIDLGGLCGGLFLGGLYLAFAGEGASASGGFGALALGVGGGLLGAALLTSDMEPDERNRQLDTTSWVPTVAPVQDGHGAVLGMAGAL